MDILEKVVLELLVKLETLAILVRLVRMVCLAYVEFPDNRENPATKEKGVHKVIFLCECRIIHSEWDISIGEMQSSSCFRYNKKSYREQDSYYNFAQENFSFFSLCIRVSISFITKYNKSKIIGVINIIHFISLNKGIMIRGLKGEIGDAGYQGNFCWLIPIYKLWMNI